MIRLHFNHEGHEERKEHEDRKRRGLFTMGKVEEAIKEIHDAIYPVIGVISDQSHMDELQRQIDLTLQTLK